MSCKDLRYGVDERKAPEYSRGCYTFCINAPWLSRSEPRKEDRFKKNRIHYNTWYGKSENRISRELSDRNMPEDRIFVVQKHDATHLHYDLRLEIDNVLKSWAVPKTPPMDANVKRLAVQTEDHPLSYADFEGTIAEGLYGAGNVEIWDKGTFKPEKIEENKIVFELDGKKLKGSYVLLKLKPRGTYGGENNWLLFKKKR